MALQAVRFELNRAGAKLESEAAIRTKKSVRPTRMIVFNGPFLVLLRKRGAELPFFVLWVDDGKLLAKP